MSHKVHSVRNWRPAAPSRGASLNFLARDGENKRPMVRMGRLAGTRILCGDPNAMGLEPFVDEGGLSVESRGRHGRRSRWKTEAVEDLAGGLRRMNR